MKAEAEANAEADKKAKEEIEKLNAADSLVFNTEKQLKEFGDKVPADKKAAIEEAKNKLRDAHTRKDFPAMEAATAELQNAWQAASADMYANQPGDGAAQPGDDQNPNAGGQQKPNDGDQTVQDVDFEEVK